MDKKKLTLPIVLRSKFRFKINIYKYNFLSAIKNNCNINEKNID